MHINPNIEKPIFIQIAEQLEDSIFTKVFPEETKIPSTNELSSLLNINPHTVLKGMNLLVDEEIIYKKRGLGMFVKKGAVNKILLKRQSQFYEQYVAALIQEASKLHMKKEEIISILDPINFTGRAPSQVTAFLEECVYPILEANKELLGEHAELNV